MREIGAVGITRMQRQLLHPALPARYEPQEIVGRGAMGVVWRVHDRVLARDVAVKVLAEHVADEGLAERLAREARILARLEHPGIVTVHDAGSTDDGRSWYAMRFIRGRRLDDPSVPPPTIGDVIRLMTRLTETIAFAHQHGIIHRDLKPANIMVGPFGELLVLDWGVAGAVAGDRENAARAPTDSASTHLASTDTATTAESGTAHGTVLGTPGYMAPEQAAGLRADVRSDVYGLGAILRDLIASHGRDVPRPLAAIRDRALAPAASDRYPDAVALADDLRRFQDGMPVAAYRESVFEMFGRWVSRYRMPIALVVAYLVMRLLIFVWGGL